MGGKLNIPLVKADLPDFVELAPMFEAALSSGRLTNFGRYATQFESLVSQRLGVQAVSVSSGTAALILALQALGVMPGDKVVLPSYTFTATAQAVLYLGAVPVFAEVGVDKTLCAADLAQVLATTTGIAAVVGVHVHGVVCDVAAISTAVRHAEQVSGTRIALIFDAAHAFGSERDGVKVGGFGDAEVFSLSVTKALVCGEGGLVTTRDEQLVAKLRSKRNYGVAANYNATEMGLNGKLSELHAAIGCVNITKLDGVLAQRQDKAAWYRDCLSTVVRRIGFAPVPVGVVSTWKDFNVLLDADLAPRRAEIAARLQAQGVETRAYFSPPVHLQTRFARYATRPLPVTEDLSARVLTLPFFTVITEEQMIAVVRALSVAIDGLGPSTSA